MVFSSSIIEEWLLSGKAVYKNLACGNAGLVQIPVPEGKTYIITKITILPFANIITDAETFAAPNTLSNTETQDLRNINKRSQYQLLFWNERVNNSWNVRNSFGLNTASDFSGVTETLPTAYYEKQEIDCFMLVESNSFLFLKYIDFDTNPTLVQAQLSDISNINWPASPNFGYFNQFDIINYDQISGEAFNYVPQGYNTSYATPSSNFNDNLVLPAFPEPSTSFFIPPDAFLPGESGGPLTKENFLSLPLYNIEYIEVNRRLSTTGLL